LCLVIDIPPDAQVLAISQAAAMDCRPHKQPAIRVTLGSTCIEREGLFSLSEVLDSTRSRADLKSKMAAFVEQLRTTPKFQY
jgi:hypothetical protein